ncbi:tetratricopeptide repeat protein [Photobacterium nomapromontoriensis]|uniref:tetratricopeptide repeat protein n=1 Tax=Photobacterium nomapromontoriensis TaxID=2910237 RepID=UPI003D0F5606
MSIKILLLIFLSVIPSVHVYADNAESVYTIIKANRVSIDRSGIITHGYNPDSTVYYASNAEKKEGVLRIQGATYRGDPEFDWRVSNGFYAFCDNQQVKLGVTYHDLDFKDVYTTFIFTLDDGTRFFYEPTIVENKPLYSPAFIQNRYFFHPTASFIHALKQAQSVQVKIETEGRLNSQSYDVDDMLPMNGFAEMITRVMNHCPETAPDIDMASLSESQRLLAKAKQLWHTQYYDEAATLLKRASQKGKGEASLWLSNYYQYHTDGDNRMALTHQARSLGAKQGNVEAMCALSVDYITLKNTDRADRLKGLALLEKAQADGAQCADFHLGYMYITGTVVEKDVPRGREYLKRAVEYSPQALSLLLDTYKNSPKAMDAEVYPWVKLMVENHGFEWRKKKAICQRSPDVCEKEKDL